MIPLTLLLLAAVLAAGAQASGTIPESVQPAAATAGIPGGNPGSTGSIELAAMSELERRTLALDIAVSNYYELASWAVSKGLSTEGSAADMRARLYAYFGVAAPEAPKVDSSLTIESASSFEYFTMEESGDRVISFHGPVALKLRTDDGFSHSIKADEVLFDRDSKIVEAHGSVTYIRAGAGRSDEFRGEDIVVDLDSYAGVFLDGSYDLAPSGDMKRTLSFNFQKLLRRSQDLTILEDARITACDEAVPHYHIRARKVWLFGNGDWALSGATLYVGIVPLAWLPFFYYPSDDILFHPVLGYRAREGAYAQTTTYLLGAGLASDATKTSSLSMFASSGGKRELKGIFLKQTQSASAAGDKTTTPASLDRLAVMADIYSALGVYLGTKGHFEDKTSGSLDFTLSAAASRSLFLESNGYYSPFDYVNSYGSTWNGSSIFGLQLPLRFGLDLAYKKSGGSAGLRYSIALLIPFYSDPYYLQDFSRRNESSSVLSAFSGNTTTLTKMTALTQSLMTSATWNPARDTSSALLSSVNLSKFGAQMTWKTRSQSTTSLTSAQRRALAVDPQRDFFYPDDLKFLDTALSLSGVLARFASETGKKDHAGEGTGEEQPAVRSSLTWTAAATGSADEKFLSNAWVKPADINGDPSYVMVEWKGSLGLNSDTQFFGNLMDFKTSLSLGAQDQFRPIFYDERISPTTVHPYKLSDFAYTSGYSDMSSSLSLSPFAPTSPLASTSLSYTIGGRLFSYSYSGLSGSGVDATPLYSSTWIGWDSTTLTTHAATATLGYNSSPSLSQRLTIQANLPPQLEKYSAAYSFNQKFVNASIQAAVSRLSSSADLLPSNLTASLSLGGSPLPVLRSDMSWDFDVLAPSSSVTSLEYLWAKAAFTAKKAKGYSFASGLWSEDASNYFRPFEVSLAVNPRFTLRGGKLSVDGGTLVQTTAAVDKPGGATQAAAESTLGFQVNPRLSYSQNFIKFTDSSLGAALDLTLSTKDGTSLQVSAASANKAAWRYWAGIFPATSSFNPSAYSKNPFVDLWESFSIWDSSALKRSLFKLQSLSLTLAQDLHDWNLSASLSMNPLLYTPDSGRPYYELDFSFSLAVTWKDIPELKTSLSYTQGAFGG